MMWQAAGSESKVAPQVLKTILLILKGKPGEIEDYLIERRRFSIDTTNMMPVAVSDASLSLPWRRLPDPETSTYPRARSCSGSVIHPSFTQHVFVDSYSVPLPVRDPVRAGERHRHRTEKYAVCQMTGGLEEMQSAVGDRKCYREGSGELVRAGLSAELMSNGRPE